MNNILNLISRIVAFFLPIVVLLSVLQCTSGTKDQSITSEEQNNSSNIDKTDINKKIKSSEGPLYFHEFGLRWVNAKAYYDQNQRLTTLVTYREEASGDSVEYFKLVLTRNKDHQITNLSKKVDGYTEEKEFKPISENIFRSTSGETEITLDSSGNIMRYLIYSNTNRDFPIFYYQSRRNERGDETEVIVEKGELDAEVTKAVFEYLEFDTYGNWTKRRIRSAYSIYDLDEFIEAYKSKEGPQYLKFPVQLEGDVDEVIEERKLEYY